MLIKLDENLGELHAEFLRQAGYDVDRVNVTFSALNN